MAPERMDDVLNPHHLREEQTEKKGAEVGLPSENSTASE
jgi:hypothetical protein